MPEKDPKLEALRDGGSLNPRPQDVSDPLFANDSFFDPRDLVQVKYEMLRRVQNEGHSVTGAATAFGFSRPSFYQALSALEQGGRALFLRSGMTAWMQAWSQCTVTPMAHSQPAMPATIPIDLRTQVATLLAGIILSLHQEATQ
jgi:hypothetical protein